MNSPLPSTRKCWRRSPRGRTKSCTNLSKQRQRFVFCRDDLYHLELDVVIGSLGHKSVVPARRGRDGAQEVSADELKPPHYLGLALLTVNWLFSAVVGLVYVARGQRVSETDSRLGDVPRGLHGALVRIPEALVRDVLVQMSQALVADVRSPPPP